MALSLGAASVPRNLSCVLRRLETQDTIQRHEPQQHLPGGRVPWRQEPSRPHKIYMITKLPWWGEHKVRAPLGSHSIEMFVASLCHLRTTHWGPVVTGNLSVWSWKWTGPASQEQPLRAEACSRTAMEVQFYVGSVEGERCQLDMLCALESVEPQP